MAIVYAYKLSVPSKLRWLFAIIPLVVVGGLVTARIQAKGADAARLEQEQKARRGAAPSVEIATAMSRDLVDSIDAVGTINSPYSVGISPRVTGRITYLEAREGDSVSAGQILARIDPSEANAAVLENQATLSEARSRLAQAQATTQSNEVQIEQNIRRERAEVASAQAAVVQAKTSLDERLSDAQASVKSSHAAMTAAAARLRNADAELKAVKVVLANTLSRQKRVENLLEKGYVSAQEAETAAGATATAQANVYVKEGGVESAQADLDSARVQLEANEARVKTIRASGEAEIKAAQARVDQAKAALAQAEANRSQSPAYKENVNALRAGVNAAEAQLKAAGVNRADTELKSSITGSVTARNGDPGSIASPNQPILQVQFLDWLYVDASLPVSESSRVSKGLPVEIRIDGIDGKVFTGKVDQVVPSANAQDRQFVVKVRVENPRREIKPGMYARVKIEVNRTQARVVIPNDALAEDGSVTVLDPEDTATKRKVTLGRQVGKDVEITDGLKIGDRVVVLAFNPVKEGAKVNIEAERLTDGTRRLMAKDQTSEDKK